MEDSILKSVKKSLGISPDDKSFDEDVLMHINSTFSVLQQLGIGPPEGFQIEDKTSGWEEFIGTDKRLNMVKTYVHQKVRLVFDPPATGYLVEAAKAQILETEVRLVNLVPIV